MVKVDVEKILKAMRYRAHGKTKNRDIKANKLRHRKKILNATALRKDENKIRTGENSTCAKLKINEVRDKKNGPSMGN